MKTCLRLVAALAALFVATSLLAAPKDAGKQKTASAPPILMIPGDPGRPYVVVGNTYGVFSVDYKVTFSKGAGAGVSYLDASLNGFDLIRKDAERQGADAVIYLSIIPIPLADTVVKDETEIMSRKNFVLIQFFGTCVKFKDAVPVTDGTK